MYQYCWNKSMNKMYSLKERNKKYVKNLYFANNHKCIPTFKKWNSKLLYFIFYHWPIIWGYFYSFIKIIHKSAMCDIYISKMLFTFFYYCCHRLKSSKYKGNTLRNSFFQSLETYTNTVKNPEIVKTKTRAVK